MDIINEFKAIYNPYTRNLLVRYGTSLIEHYFEETEEWVEINFDNDDSQPYYLHVQLDYDETFQLLFYPRKEESSSLNEEYGSYYNSEESLEEHPKNIILVHTDREWDNRLDDFLEASVEEFYEFRKIKY